MNHIAILDIGKTNKKCLVFDDSYRIVLEESTVFPETADEDGFPCEDIFLLRQWVLETVRALLLDPRFSIRAINCTAYGASFVHLGIDGEPVAPLYNYLKPFPPDLKNRFFDTYGGAERMALETASPVLGHLNSGLQLYWLKHARPGVFERVEHALHLPQYVAFLIASGIEGQEGPAFPVRFLSSEITSIGCHTLLWDFAQNRYHRWVGAEGIEQKFPPIRPSQQRFQHRGSPGVRTGIGLHDSSAALLPYLASFEGPFVLLSTGTWCISLNPFNHEPLSPAELLEDCLCYLSWEGRPVKAARFFGGHEHAQAAKGLAAAFGVAEDFYKSIRCPAPTDPEPPGELVLQYLAFMRQLVEKQAASTRLSIGHSEVRCIYVDGGFSKNQVYMSLLAQAFPGLEVFAASVAQATALGAALAIHSAWNEKPLPPNLVSLEKIRP